MSRELLALLETADYLAGCMLACRDIGDASGVHLYFDRAAEVLDEAMELAFRREVPHAAA